MGKGQSEPNSTCCGPNTSWANVNISATLERPADGLVIQAYVKNLFDKTPITDAFTNSDDTGLTTNVFTLDPRLVAVSVSKRF